MRVASARKQDYGNTSRSQLIDDKQIAFKYIVWRKFQIAERIARDNICSRVIYRQFNGSSLAKGIEKFRKLVLKHRKIVGARGSAP